MEEYLTIAVKAAPGFAKCLRKILLSHNLQSERGFVYKDDHSSVHPSISTKFLIFVVDHINNEYWLTPFAGSKKGQWKNQLYIDSIDGMVHVSESARGEYLKTEDISILSGQIPSADKFVMQSYMNTFGSAVCESNFVIQLDMVDDLIEKIHNIIS